MRGRPWAALVVLLVAGLAAGVWWVLGSPSPSQLAQPGHPSSSSATPAPAAAPTRSALPRSVPDAAQAAPIAALAQVLQRATTAVQTHDAAGYRAVLDPLAPGLQTRRMRMFARLGTVPLGAWAYQLDADSLRRAAAVDAQQRPDAGDWTAHVRLSYGFEGVATTFERDREVTFARRPGNGWVITRDVPAGTAYTGGVPDVWELGPVSVARGRSSLVIGSGDRAALRDTAELADRAVRNVGRVWKQPWSRQPVIVVPSGEKAMAALTASDRQGLGQVAALTTGVTQEGTGSSSDEVVLNPRSWLQLRPAGRNVVMTHEVTHLATRAYAHERVPMWLSEGFADYVAYLPHDLSVQVVAAGLVDEVRDGRVPTDLPRRDDFDAAKGETATAYEGAWMACRMIAQRYGQDSLVRLYEETSADSGSPQAAIKEVLGRPEAAIVADWRAYLRTEAAR